MLVFFIHRVCLHVPMAKRSRSSLHGKRSRFPGGQFPALQHNLKWQKKHPFQRARQISLTAGRVVGHCVVRPPAAIPPFKIPRKADTSRLLRICVLPESLENTGTPLREHHRMDRLERRQAVAELLARAVRRRAAVRRQSRDSSESVARAVDLAPEIRLTVSQPPGTPEPRVWGACRDMPLFGSFGFSHG
jgi:hypothetical protein